MYRLSARQILLIALLSALFSAGAVTGVNYFQDRLQPGTAAFVEANGTIPGISEPSAVTDERNNIEVFRTLAPGVVSITTTSRGRNFFEPEREGGGSGSIIDREGHILTNDHVIAGAAHIGVSFGNGESYPARLIGTDPSTDLAVIKVNAPRELLTLVPFGNSDELIVGQKVLAIGNPFGLDRTLTTGVISGLQRPIRSRPMANAPDGRLIEGAVQTDASINPGNSGGPLLDARGRMIGINSQILSPAGGSVGVGFAVPVNIAKRVVPQLIRNGEVIRPQLGATTYVVRDLIRQGVRLPVESGLGVYQVYQGGAAAAAGLRGLRESYDGDIAIGDIILSIDGEPMNNRDDLFRILDRRNIGDTVQLEILRDGRRSTVPMQLVPERRGFLRR